MSKERIAVMVERREDGQCVVTLIGDTDLVDAQGLLSTGLRGVGARGFVPQIVHAETPDRA